MKVWLVEDEEAMCLEFFMFYFGGYMRNLCMKPMALDIIWSELLGKTREKLWNQLTTREIMWRRFLLGFLLENEYKVPFI